jgi:hypothetical protein
MIPRHTGHQPTVENAFSEAPLSGLTRKRACNLLPGSSELSIRTLSIFLSYVRASSSTHRDVFK